MKVDSRATVRFRFSLSYLVRGAHLHCRRELRRIVQDIRTLGALHCGLTAFNFVLGKNSQTKHCPRHNVVHRWRIIDSHRSSMIDPTHCATVDNFDIKHQSLNGL